MRTTVEETMLNDERILTAAIEVFSQKGYEAASMQDIADQAGISRGPLYYRYKSKKALFIAALDAYLQQELDNHMHIFRQHKPFIDKLREYLYYGTRYFREGATGFIQDFFADPRMEDINAKIRESYKWAYLQVHNMIIMSVQNGDLKPDADVDCIVNLMFIFFDGVRSSRLKTGIIPSASKLDESIENFCLLLNDRYGTA